MTAPPFPNQFEKEQAAAQAEQDQAAANTGSPVLAPRTTHTTPTRTPLADMLTGTIKAPVPQPGRWFPGRAPQPVDPIRDEALTRLEVMGLAYAPSLTPNQSRAVARRLYDWSDGDPELARMIDEDFASAVDMSQVQWFGREDTILAKAWWEAHAVIESIRGRVAADDRRVDLDRRAESAEAAGPDAAVVAMMERSPQDREQYVFNQAASDAVFALNSGGGLLGIGLGLTGIFRATSRAEAASQANLLTSAQERERLERRAAVEASPELATALLAQHLLSTGKVSTAGVATDSALEVFDAMSDEERQRLIVEVREARVEDLVASFEGAVTEETPTQVATRKALEATMDTLATWDAVSHTLGIQFLEELQWKAQVAGEAVGLTDGPTETGRVTPLDTWRREGFEAFQASFQATKEEGIAGYYGMEKSDPMFGWVNLASAMAFDPLNWVTLGGAGQTKLAAKWMKSAAGADAYLASRRGVDLVKTITKTDDVLQIAPALHGMSGSGRRILLNTTDDAVAADVIRNEIANGTYLMNGPALAMRHQSYLGAGELGRLLADGDAKVYGTKIGDWLTEALRRQDYTRQVRIGEDGFLDDATELIVARFPTNPDKAREWLTKVYDRFDDFMRGGEELAAERIVRAQQLRKESSALWKQSPVPVRQVGKARTALTEARAERVGLDQWMADLTGEMDRTVGGVLTDTAAAVGDAGTVPVARRSVDDILRSAAEADQAIKSLDDRIKALEWHTDTYGARYDEVRAKRVELIRESQKLRRANTAAAIPRSRTSLVQWFDEFMDDWALELELPRNADGRVMWSEVRSPGSRAGIHDDAGRLGPFGAMRETAEMLGVGSVGSHHWLPVTPYELAVYRGAKEAGGLTNLSKTAWQRGVLPLIRAANTMWAVNLLFNPLNAAKAHFEDVIKFGRAGGSARDMLRAAVGRGTDDPRGNQFIRQTLVGLERRRAPWTTVERGSRGHFDAAKRWLEGTALQDEALRAWSQATLNNDPTVWTRWWDEVGQFRVKGLVVPMPGQKSVALTSETAFGTVGRIVDELAGASLEPAEFRRMLIEAAGTGKREVPAAMAKMAGSMPVEAQQMGSKVGYFFDKLYGAPARGRGGVFFDHYHEQAMDIFEARWQGRIIDDRLDDIVESGLARSVTEAETLVAMRDPGVDDFLRQAGLITRARLEQSATDFAGRHAQSLMYLSGASSRAGRGLAVAAPFAPAQFDFMRWWSRQMSAGTDFAIAGRSIGHLQGLNFRLASQFSHLGAESGRRDETTSPSNPINLLERFTFLPIALDDPDNFLADFLPGFGPVPTWLLHLLPPDNKFRETMEGLIPSLGWVTGEAQTPEGIARHLLPPTTRSLTGVAGWAIRGAAAGTDSPTLDKWLDSEMAGGLFDLARKPIGSSDVLKFHLGEALAANPNLTPGVDTAALAAIIDESLDEANSREAVRRFKIYVGAQSRFGSDNMSIVHYGPLVDAVARFAESGVVGKAQADQLVELWAKIESGEATPPETDLFGNSAVSALLDLPDDVRDRLVAENPQLAVNMVSTIQCRMDSSGQPVAPDGYCRPDGRVDTNNPDLRGSKGADVRRRGFELGWFEPRPETDWVVDTIYIFNQARSRSARNLWESLTGQEYSKRLTKKFNESTFTLSDEAAAAATKLGIRLDPKMAGSELRAAFSNALASYPQDKVSVSDNPLYQRLRQVPEYGPVLDTLNQIEDRLAEEDIGVTSMYDWAEPVKELARGLFAELAVTDPSILTGYNTYLRGALGPLDYEPPTPPAESELANRIAAAPSDVTVVDGDTITLHAADGDIRVRVIGLNAPEQGQPGYVEAWEQLEQLIERAGSITVGQYNPELFGATQEVDADQKRLFGWLYIDGVPLYDASVFTSTNPAGVRTGGTTPDYAALLTNNRGAQ